MKAQKKAQKGEERRAFEALPAEERAAAVASQEARRAAKPGGWTEAELLALLNNGKKGQPRNPCNTAQSKGKGKSKGKKKKKNKQCGKKGRPKQQQKKAQKAQTKA